MPFQSCVIIDEEPQTDGYLHFSAVAMGVAKAVYQTGFIKEFDWTFRSSVTFWGL